jgi:hypothetical protein
MQDLGNELNNISDQSGAITTDEQNQAGWDVNTLYPQMVQQEIGATSDTRSGTLSNLKEMGGKYQAQIGALNPNWQAALGMQNSMAASAASGASNSPLLGEMNTEAMTAAPTALTNQLGQVASSNLALGAGLSPEQQEQAQQVALAGASQRGMADSNGALAGEILNTDQYGQQLLAQRQQAAGAANAQGLQNMGLINQVQQQTQGQNLNQQGQNVQTVGANTAAQQNALAPTLGFFSPNTQTPVSATAPGSIMNSAAGQMDPMLSYGSNLYDWNYNAQAATLLNNANNMAAINGAVIGATGEIIGGAASGCWVAREILGTADDQWLWFRAWMLEDAPGWFRSWYIEHGEAAAEWLRKHGWLKALLRPWFARIAARKRARVEYGEELKLTAKSAKNAKLNQIERQG